MKRWGVEKVTARVLQHWGECYSGDEREKAGAK
jgi:hypothetical protein